MASSSSSSKKETPSDLENINLEMTQRSTSSPSPPPNPLPPTEPSVKTAADKVRTEISQYRRELQNPRKIVSQCIAVLYNYVKENEAEDYLLHRPPHQIDPFENRDSSCNLL